MNWTRHHLCWALPCMKIWQGAMGLSWQQCTSHGIYMPLARHLSWTDAGSLPPTSALCCLKVNIGSNTLEWLIKGCCQQDPPASSTQICHCHQLDWVSNWCTRFVLSICKSPSNLQHVYHCILLPPTYGGVHQPPMWRLVLHPAIPSLWCCHLLQHPTQDRSTHRAALKELYYTTAKATMCIASVLIKKQSPGHPWCRE